MQPNNQFFSHTGFRFDLLEPGSFLLRQVLIIDEQRVGMSREV